MERKFLVGSRIHLRPLVKKDMEGNYIKWFDDAGVCNGNSHHVFPMSVKQFEQFIETPLKDSLVFAVVLSSDNIHIGNIALQCINYINRTAEYTIIIGEKEYWGKGYSKEASELIIKHGFVELNIRRICLGTFETNNGMINLAKKLGFVEEGRRREAVYKNGKYIDIIEYGLLRGEWEARVSNVKE
jgi:RimJ/RimL family protein N-acetyltransferase